VSGTESRRDSTGYPSRPLIRRYQARGPLGRYHRIMLVRKEGRQSERTPAILVERAISIP
jgi:hypothetical protein